MLPDSPRPSSDMKTLKSSDTPPIDNVIGYIYQTSKAYLMQKLVSNIGSKNSSSLGKTSKVHVVHSTTTNKSYKGKNKGKGKAKVDA